MFSKAGPKKRSLTIPMKVTSPLSQFGIISIEDGIVKKKVVYSTLHKRLDFGLFLNDVGGNLISTPQVSKLMKQFPGVVSSTEQNKTLEKKKSEKVSWDEIEKILSDEIGRFYLKVHATNEYSVENILIYEEIANFKGMPLQQDFKLENQIKKAHEIYNNFLTPDSIMQLNITDELASDYQERIKKLDETKDKKIDLTDFFEDLMIEIRTGVLKDTYSRFKQSRYFEDFKNGSHGEKTITYLI